MSLIWNLSIINVHKQQQVQQIKYKTLIHKIFNYCTLVLVRNESSYITKYMLGLGI